jgi:hypothetical protein
MLTIPIQAFHLYAEASLWEVLQYEWKHFGPMQLIFAGVPASFLYHLAIFYRHKAIDFCDFFVQQGFEPFKLPKHWALFERFPAKVKKMSGTVLRRE